MAMLQLYTTRKHMTFSYIEKYDIQENILELSIPIIDSDLYAAVSRIS